MRRSDSDHRQPYDDIQVSIDLSYGFSLFVLLLHQFYLNTALYHRGSACPCLSETYRRRNVIVVTQSGMFSDIMA